MGAIPPAGICLSIMYVCMGGVGGEGREGRVLVKMMMMMMVCVYLLLPPPQAVNQSRFKPPPLPKKGESR